MIYSITAFSFFYFSLLFWDKRNQARPIFILALVWLFIHDGFRWEIGTDWESYYRFFTTGENSHMGLGYTWLNDIFKCFTDQFTVLLIFIAAVTYITLGRFFLRYSPNCLMSITVYYCTMIGMLGCNRQILAMMLTLFSLKFIFERKLLPFLMVMFLALLFHVSSLVFIPAYFLYGKQYTNKFIILALMFAFVVGVTRVINHIPFVNYLSLLDSVTNGATQYGNYVDNFDSGVSLFGSLKRVLFVSLALCVRNKVNNVYYDYFLALFAAGCFMYLLFNGSVLQIVAGRGAAYYNIYETIVIPFMIIHFPLDVRMKKIYWFCLFLIYFYLMWRDMNSYIEIEGYDIYSPYKNIFFL